MSEFSHFDETGAIRMVDVGEKPVTRREAIAEGYVTMQPATLQKILHRELAKGNVLEIARIAGLMAVKQTADLIPLCHPLPLDSAWIELEPELPEKIRIVATVGVSARTGVEMEALTAVTVAALTIYDMCKGVDRAMQLGPFRLLEKSGGQSGQFRAQG